MAEVQDHGLFARLSRHGIAPAWMIAGAASLSALLLTVLLVVGAAGFYERQLAQRFEWAASERAAAMQISFNAHMADLDSVRRFFINADEVTANEFSGYAAGLLHRTLSYSWLPRVTDAQRDAFEAKVRSSGYPSFTLRDLAESGALVPAARREEHFPLRYIVSTQAFDAILGLDLNSHAGRRQTLEHARRNGLMAASEVIRFVATDEADRYGLLLVAPIFVGQPPEDEALRLRTPLRGYVAAAFSQRQLMEEGGSEESARNLSLELRDISPIGGKPLQYQSAVEPADSELLLQRELRLADRVYELRIRPTAVFIQANSSYGTAILLIAGVLLSALVGLLLFSLVSQRQRARNLVSERTAELRSRERELATSEQRWSFALEGAGDGVWDWDIVSDRLFLSHSSICMLGYAPDAFDATSRNWMGLVHEQDLPACQLALSRHLRDEEAFFRHEYRMRCQDGSWKWLLGRGKVVERGADGRPLRIIGTHSDISWRKAAELELAQANAQLQGVMAAATQVAIITTDLDGVIRTFNAGAELMLGYPTSELVGLATPLLFHVREEIEQSGQVLSARYGRRIDGFEVFVATAEAENRHDEQEWTYVRKDGGRVMVNLIVTGMRDAGGELIGYLGIASDITERKRTRQALEARDRLLEKLTASVPGAIYQYQLNADGSSSFPFSSAGIRAIYEMEPDTLREDASQVFERIHPEDLERIRQSIRRSAEQLSPWCQDYRVLLPRQGLRWLRGEATPEALANDAVLWHGYLTDITGLKLVEQELRALSITDVLTGSYNRRYFQERLEVEIARVQRFAGTLSVVMLDIDHFKRINDSYGHDAGDRVLQEVCARMRQRVRSIDVFCRLGGEEFIVLCPGTDGQQAAALANGLQQVLRTEPVDGVGYVTASFGVASWRAGEGADSMLRRVDAGVYAAKQGGRDRVQLEQV
ncbi:MAG: sensor domain-containing diguanylate cyclase [Pseudomonas sp.]